MDQCGLIFPRKLVWNKDAWREPARIGLAILICEGVLADEDTSPEHRAEAEMLIRNLRLAGKKPPGAI